MSPVIFVLAMMVGGTAWNDFSEWFSREGTPGAPADVLQAYTKKLEARGVGKLDIAAQSEEIRKYMAAHPGEALVLHFNRIYTWGEAPFRREPSELVKKVAGSRKPGRALDIAMGQGRNAVWLAKAGWNVSGYDISPVALREASAAAAAAGVKLDTRIASHEDFELGNAQWDLIVMCFAFTKLSDAAYMERVRDSLQPGGVLIVEGSTGDGRLSGT